MKPMFIVLFAFVMSLNSWADNSAGCGLGSMIWRENSLVSALFRLTTNHSFSSQLFGLTTGTSGCSTNGIVKRDMAPIYYAEANLEELKIDMAKGHGEYVGIFSDALGCPETLKPLFTKISKEKFNDIFSSPETSPTQMVTNVKNVIQSEKNLSGQCLFASL